MIYDRLRSVARRKGFVRWQRSKIVERLRLARDPELSIVAEVMESKRNKIPYIVLAKNLITGQEHPIKPFADQIEFECVEISPSTPVRVGDLLPKNY